MAKDITINFLGPNGRKIEMVINPDDRIHFLKAKLADFLACPTEQIVMGCDCGIYSDHHTLRYYDIDEDGYNIIYKRVNPRKRKASDVFLPEILTDQFKSLKIADGQTDTSF